jgi:Kef-type K+ transport system membrane component KefB
MRLHIEEAEFSLAIILILALAYLTDVIGFSSVLGAFIAGVLISRTPFAEMRSFSDRVKALSFGLFIPIFFVWFGLEINLAQILKYAALAGLIFLAYILIRFIITYAFMRKYRVKTPLLIGASVLSVDVESLVIILIALQLGIFATDLPLTLFAPSVLLSTLFIVLLVTIFSKIELKKIKGVLKKAKE